MVSSKKSVLCTINYHIGFTMYQLVSLLFLYLRGFHLQRFGPVYPMHSRPSGFAGLRD